ncbi:MAG: bifunctional enoyl-CoA hydratase/phosphate acetyltransferase [Alphaproteobacteria bacterium]|nr:bifunctional enoyl-CoA hydratase/phosphate acetyltransferase [Alphaproteobacteria bacterium]
MLSTAPVECPPALLARAKGRPPVPMAIAGAGERVALESARAATGAGLITPILVGEPEAIRRLAAEIGWDIAAHRLVAATGETETARAAVALAAGGEAKAVMKGYIHTDALMLAMLERTAGLRTGRRVSHVFHMTVPGSDRALMITDGAVNIAPSLDDKVDITQNAIDLAHALGNPAPRVAIITGVETVTTRVPSSVDAAALVQMAARGQIRGGLVDGPFGLDNAISPAAALLKGLGGPVAGNADIVVVPDFVSGNFLFKALVYYRSACAAGIVLGAKVPVVLTSRADPAAARLAACAIAALMASA